MLFFSNLCVPLHRESRIRIVQFIRIIVNKVLVYPPFVVIRVAVFLLHTPTPNRKFV